MSLLRPLDEVLHELRLALERGATFEYCEEVGPNRIGRYCVSTDTSILGDEDKDIELVLEVYIEVPTPRSVLELDPEGIRAIAREYGNALAALRGILEWFDSVDSATLDEIQEEYELHGDMIHYQAPLLTLEDARKLILRARQAAGLREPLTLSGLTGLHSSVYRALVLALARGIIRVALQGETPGPEGVGWVSARRIAGELDAELDRVENALEALVEGGYAEKHDSKYRARPGTGSLAESISSLPALEACLLAPYAHGYTHLEWRIYYAGEDDCVRLGTILTRLESRGVRIV